MEDNSGKKKKNNCDSFIKEIAQLFGEPNVEEFVDDIEKAKNLEKKSPPLNSILIKYEKIKLDKKSSKNMLEDIVSALIKKRKDFALLMNIYMNLIDNLVSESLRKHLILKDTSPKKIEDKSNDTNGYTIKIDIGLLCLDDNDKYYHKFIKGMLKYIKSSFNKDYLNSYLNQSYFDNPDKSSKYTNNIEDITSSLENLLNNIKLVLKLESDHKVPFQPENNEKIAENKYKILYLKAQLHKIKDIGVLGIYTQSKNNKEILENIQKLLEANKDLIELIIFEDSFKEYMKNVESEMKRKKLEESNSLKDKELFIYLNENREIKNDINKLKENTNKLKENINNLMEKITINEKRIEIQQKEINELESKVNYLEPIVFALISRKVINYALRQIINNYKKNLKITLFYNKRNETNFVLSFITDPVSELNKTDANILLNDLFKIKSSYNPNSHLEGKTIAPFITDIWDFVEKNIKFDKKEELVWFNKIITKDIKSGFIFGDRDISVKDYLKTVNTNEFGEFQEIRNP